MMADRTMAWRWERVKNGFVHNMDRSWGMSLQKSKVRNSKYSLPPFVEEVYLCGRDERMYMCPAAERIQKPTQVAGSLGVWGRDRPEG